MSYLIRTVGIDLAPVWIGISTMGYRSQAWEAQVYSAGAFHLNANANSNRSKFQQHCSLATKIVEYVKKVKPDLVGLEDYTNQSRSHIAFSMGELGGVVRLMLYQAGYRQLLITPHRVAKLVLPPNSGLLKKKTTTRRKKAIVKWVAEQFKVEFQGTPKEISDMADSVCYGYIAACFFAYYWLHEEPPMLERQREVFFNKVPHKNSKLAQSGWIPKGLMDMPGRFLVRNYDKEPEVYTPDWIRNMPVDPILIG